MARLPARPRRRSCEQHRYPHLKGEARPGVPPEDIAAVNAVWMLEHYLDEPAAFAGLERNERLADRCAYCLGTREDCDGLPVDSVGVTCPAPEGAGTLDYGQLVRVELGGRLLHGEFITFDEPDLDVPGEWTVSLPVCGVACNLLIRALARAEPVREARSLLDAALPDDGDSTPFCTEDGLLDPPFENPDPSDLLAVAAASLDEWIEDLLEDEFLKCTWCGRRLTGESVAILWIATEVSHRRSRRISMRPVRLAHRLASALAYPFDPASPWACLLCCGRDCQRAATQAVGASRSPRSH